MPRSRIRGLPSRPMSFPAPGSSGVTTLRSRGGQSSRKSCWQLPPQLEKGSCEAHTFPAAVELRSRSCQGNYHILSGICDKGAGGRDRGLATSERQPDAEQTSRGRREMPPHVWGFDPGVVPLWMGTGDGCWTEALLRGIAIDSKGEERGSLRAGKHRGCRFKSCSRWDHTLSPFDRCLGGEGGSQPSS